MTFNLTKPCEQCPFLRRGEHAIRLRRGRIREITEGMLDSQGSLFPCHKTVDQELFDTDDEPDPAAYDHTEHCAGALLFAENNGYQTHGMRTAGRIGMYNPELLEGHRDVFADAEEFYETAIP